MSGEAQAIETGEQIVRLLMPRIAEIELALPEELRLQLWAGVFASLGGACVASIGPAALVAIGEITARLSQRVLADRMN